VQNDSMVNSIHGGQIFNPFFERMITNRMEVYRMVICVNSYLFIYLLVENKMFYSYVITYMTLPSRYIYVTVTWEDIFTISDSLLCLCPVTSPSNQANSFWFLYPWMSFFLLRNLILLSSFLIFYFMSSFLLLE
jgi:hypothetical protein